MLQGGLTMISFEKACQLAYSHFKNISTEYVLTSALEHDLYWIFYGGLPNRIEYGGTGIKISKVNETVEPFQLPKELKLLSTSKEISLPDDFKR